LALFGRGKLMGGTMLTSLLGEAGLRLRGKVKLEKCLLLAFSWAESERWFLTALIFNRPDI
jgi:hypothetical protein